jgi:carotenoid cleavage dioxygenase
MQSAELVRGERVQSGKYKIETKITKENRMKNPKSIIPDLKELGLLMLGFLPWILFLFLSGNTLNSLKIAVVVSLVACLVLGFGDLKRGFILSWGTLIFFVLCLILIDFLNVVWIAKEMDLLSNLAISSIMWFSVIINKPFALQYAQMGVPKEHWSDKGFIHGCMFITIFWACLMTFAFLISILKRTHWLPLSMDFYYGLTILNIVGGLTYNTYFKRKKRLQRELAAVNSSTN